MAQTGFIDWHRLNRTHHRQAGASFVYAYWLVDYGYSTHDAGLSLLKDRGEHPDWFVHGEHADKTLWSVVPQDISASPNHTQVFDNDGTARPLLASMLLGTSTETYRRDGDPWWCTHHDLTRSGRRHFKDTTMLYLREPVIVTFHDLRPMMKADPETSDDTATVAEVSG